MRSQYLYLLQLSKHVEVVFTPFPPDHVIQRHPVILVVQRLRGLSTRLVLVLLPAL